MEEIYIEPELQYIPQRKNPRRIRETEELRRQVQDLKEDRDLLMMELAAITIILLMTTIAFCVAVA